MRVTKLRVVSIGRVAEDCKNTEGLIKVIPIEMVPGIDGAIKPLTGDLTDTGTDAMEMQYSERVTCANYITATWLSLNTNRLTAPNVVENEQVLIWQYGNAADYYWTSMGRDDDLRRLETVVLAISGLPDKSDEKLDGDNTYLLEVSTHGKHITLRTSQRNGEYCRYTIQINAGEGSVSLKDDIGNLMILDSANTNIHFKNAKATVLELNKQDVNITASGNLTATLGSNVTIDAGGDITINAGGSITASAGGSMALSSSGMSLSSPTIALNGSVSVGGGARDARGYVATFNSPVVFNSPVSFNAPVTGTTFTGTFIGEHIGPCANH